MPDVKKVTVDGVTYTIKDETARNALTLKQDKLIPGDNIRIDADGKTIRTDLSKYRKAVDQDAIDATKQDKLIPGDNIRIGADGKTISANIGVSSVNGKTGYVVLDGSDIIVDRGDVESSEIVLNAAIVDLYARTEAAANGVYWVRFTPTSIDTWTCDVSWADIGAAQDDGLNIQAHFTDVVLRDEDLVLAYGGMDNNYSHIFYTIDGTKLIHVTMDFTSNISVAVTRIGDVDLSKYRKAVDQDAIDATKQDKLIPGDNIRIGADGKTISANIGVSSVNGKTGYVVLDGSDIVSATQPNPITFTIEGAFDEYNVDLYKGDSIATSQDFIAAINSGLTVLVNIHDQSKSIPKEDYIVKYTISGDTVHLYFEAPVGYNYSPALYDCKIVNQYTTLDEYDFTTTHLVYDNAHSLPFAEEVTVQDCLDSLESRVSVISNLDKIYDEPCEFVDHPGSFPITNLGMSVDEFHQRIYSGQLVRIRVEDPEYSNKVIIYWDDSNGHIAHGHYYYEGELHFVKATTEINMDTL